MENAQKIQSLLGGNPMIKNVLSNPEHMKNAQKMLQSPDVQKQIGGLISNPKVIQQASQVLSGLQQINSTQAGGRKSRRRKGGGEKFDEIMDNGKAAAVKVANVINTWWKHDEQLGDAHKERVVTVFKEALGLDYTDVKNKNNLQDKLIEKVAIFVSNHNALALEIKHGRAGDKYSKTSDAFERNLKGYNILVKSAFKDNIITSKERAELENIRNPYVFFTAKHDTDNAITRKISKIIGQIKKILNVQPDQGGRKKRRRTKKKKRRRKSTKKRRRRKSRR